MRQEPEPVRKGGVATLGCHGLPVIRFNLRTPSFLAASQLSRRLSKQIRTSTQTSSAASPSSCSRVRATERLKASGGGEALTLLGGHGRLCVPRRHRPCRRSLCAVTGRRCEDLRQQHLSPNGVCVQTMFLCVRTRSSRFSGHLALSCIPGSPFFSKRRGESFTALLLL